MAKQWRATIMFLIGGFCVGAFLFLKYHAPAQPDPGTGHVHRYTFRNETRYLTGLEEVLFPMFVLAGLISTVVSKRLQGEIDDEDRKARETRGDGNILGLRS